MILRMFQYLLLARAFLEFLCSSLLFFIFLRWLLVSTFVELLCCSMPLFTSQRLPLARVLDKFPY